MSELERDLRRLEGTVDYPETPNLAQGVQRRLASSNRVAPRWRSSSARLLAVAIGVTLLLAAGAVAAVPSTRNAVLELVGLRGVTIERVDTTPAAPEASELDLGEETSFAAAAMELDFRPLVPPALGEPDAVFLRSSVTGGELSLVYAPRSDLPPTSFPGIGLLISEFRGDLEPALLGKVVGADSRIDPFTLDGHRAIWIDGAPHELFYRAPDGEIRSNSSRLATNVLLVERGALLVRLEGSLGRSDAITLARSLR